MRGAENPVSTVNRTATAVSAVLLVGLVGALTGQTQPLPGQAQPPPSQTQPPVFRAGVNFVRVDVIVTDRQGNVVTDLKQDDFEVNEDGKPQKIELFRLVNTDGTPQPGQEPPRPITSEYAQEAEAARDDVRLFVFFMDDYHVRLGASMRVRNPLVQFIKTQLGPMDMVALMYPLTPVTGLTFTRDFDGVANAIRRFEGRKYDYRPRNDFEQQYAMYPADTVERVRNQVTWSALKGLFVKLGAMREGRKAVILVSEGYTSLLPPQLRDPSAAFPGLGNPSRGNPFAGETRAEDTARFFAMADMQTEMREIYDTANRNNTAVYALDPRGLPVNEFEINESVGTQLDGEILRSTQDTLRSLAEETDGRAIVNRNDLAAGLKQVVRDTSAYYLVGYNSSRTAADGKFHRIDVRLKRQGLQVRARKGYWAVTAEEAAAAAAPPKPRPPAAVERALGAVEATRRDAYVATWIGTRKGEGGKMEVSFVWEQLPPVPGLARQEAERVALMASDPDGYAYFRGKVPEAAAGSAASKDTAAPAPGASALRAPSRVTFDATPGKMEVRMAVENAKGQVIDTNQQQVIVPDLGEPKVAISTPAVFRARTAREFQALSRDPDPVPSALREFRRTDRLLIRFQVYGPGATAPASTVRLLGRGGQSMADLAAQPPAGPDGFYQVDLPLSGLAPGEYLVEVRAKGAAAESGEATELIPMRIIS
jgi:VWFA-related protein